MNSFTKVVLVIGRRTASTSSVEMLGTGFLISSDGKIATTKHVINGDDSNIVVLLPGINDINSYQDTSYLKCLTIPVDIVEIDPFKDIAILKIRNKYDLGSTKLIDLGSFDNIEIGTSLIILGFPHCVENRRVLTCQYTELGAKILMESNSIKSKYGVINTQTRPGQSGSIVYAPSRNEVVGMLIGAFAPLNYKAIDLGGINPRELHQTTHCLSAEYIKEMLQ